MHRCFIARLLARFMFAVVVALLPFHAVAQQTSTQQGAADQPGAAKGQPAEVQRQITQPLNNAPVPSLA
jgi:hypothetical protein